MTRFNSMSPAFEETVWTFILDAHAQAQPLPDIVWGNLFCIINLSTLRHLDCHSTKSWRQCTQPKLYLKEIHTTNLNKIKNFNRGSITSNSKLVAKCTLLREYKKRYQPSYVPNRNDISRKWASAKRIAVNLAICLKQAKQTEYA